MMEAGSRLAAVRGNAAPAAAAAVFFGAVLTVGSAFIPSSVRAPTASPQEFRQNLGMFASSARSPPDLGGGDRMGCGAKAVAAAVVGLLAASSRRRSLGSSDSRSTSPTQSCTVLVAGASSPNPVLRGCTRRQSPLVARKSLKSCYNLFFKRAYKDRARRNLRNRAYNIFHKNKYKRAMRRVLSYCVGLEFGETNPGSVEGVLADIKPQLDAACRTIDEVCVQGILHRFTAARRKDRLCRAVLRGCVAKNLIDKPKDPFIKAFEVLRYEMPVCNMVREPRPWQLPGWKSPWMLRREWNKWMDYKRKVRTDKAAMRKAEKELEREYYNKRVALRKEVNEFCKS